MQATPAVLRGTLLGLVAAHLNAQSSALHRPHPDSLPFVMLVPLDNIQWTPREPVPGKAQSFETSLRFNTMAASASQCGAVISTSCRHGWSITLGVATVRLSSSYLLTALGTSTSYRTPSAWYVLHAARFSFGVA
jgi:hypothetical protein